MKDAKTEDKWLLRKMKGSTNSIDKQIITKRTAEESSQENFSKKLKLVSGYKVG